MIEATILNLPDFAQQYMFSFAYVHSENSYGQIFCSVLEHRCAVLSVFVS